MSKVKNSDSKIELLLRKALWKAGFRYRKNSTKYFGKPDIVLPKFKTVIFIDSCFWHKCPWHYGAPATRKAFWDRKIDMNKKRDKKVNLYYRRLQWRNIRIWEHNLSASKRNQTLKIVVECLKKCFF